MKKEIVSNRYGKTNMKWAIALGIKDQIKMVKTKIGDNWDDKLTSSPSTAEIEKQVEKIYPDLLKLSEELYINNIEEFVVNTEFTKIKFTINKN